MRLVVAAAFAVMILAEWGSHGVILSHQSEPGGKAFSSTDGGHEDPCKTLICSDGTRKDQQVPSFKHNAGQHNAFFERFAGTALRFRTGEDAHLRYSKISGIFRPPDPSFHPPELS